MTQYTGSMQSVLNATLSRYQDKGFRLIESNEFGLILYYRDVRVMVFDIQEATISIIRETCQEYLKSIGECDE